jgi:hypothetical protein
VPVVEPRPHSWQQGRCRQLRRKRRLAAWVLAGAGALAGGAAGCSGTPGTDGAEAGTVGSHARIRVELDVEGPSARLGAEVRFLRYQDVDAASAEVLAGANISGEVERGRCELVQPDQRLEETMALLPEAAPARGVVQHLDAGDVAISIEGVTSAAVQALQVPALFPFVTGVEYDDLTQTVGELGLPEQPLLQVTGFGGQDIAPFDATARFPALPVGVTATLGSALTIDWAGGTGGEVSIAVQRGFGEPALRCRTDDDGAFTIDRATLGQIPGFRIGEDLVVAVERVARSRFAAPGVQTADLEAVARYVVIASAP